MLSRARMGRIQESLQGDSRHFLDRYQTLEQVDRLGVEAGGIDLNPTDLGCERDLVADAATAFDCFEQDLSRCAMIRYDGWCSEGWDTHTSTELQSINFNDLFTYLDGILADLDTRSSPTAGRWRTRSRVVSARWPLAAAELLGARTTGPSPARCCWARASAAARPSAWTARPGASPST